MARKRLRYARPERKRTRHRRGESHQNARFSSAQVRAIRKDRRTMREIAREYKCSVSTVWAVKNKVSYSNVP